MKNTCPSSNETSKSKSSSEMENKLLKNVKFNEKLEKESINLNYMCLVMELVESDLNKMLRSQCNFNETQMMRIIYNILLALAFIHESNVMHRDFKPANILLNCDCSIKVSDFGLSRTIP